MTPKTKLWRDPIWLLQQYWMERLTSPEMARLAGCNSSCITHWMKEYNIPCRERAFLEDRFWSKVDLRDDGECWEWQGARSSKGYGSLAVYGPDPNPSCKFEGAHRVSWQIHNGPIPEGLCVLHKCDNPPCVNPEHLFLGTGDDNLADMTAKGRRARGSRVGSARLTESDVLEIRRLREEDGLIYREIAERFGVGKTTVRYITARINWKHL